MEIDPLEPFLGDRPLGVAEADRAEQAQRDRVITDRDENGRFESGRAGDEVAGVIQHAGLPMNRTQALNFGLLCIPEIATL